MTKKIHIDFDTIVRDKTDSILKSNGIDATIRKLENHEMVPYLSKKIKEEAGKIDASRSPHEVMRYLIELEEASKALMHCIGIKEYDFRKKALEQRVKNGRFALGNCLRKVSVHEDHPDIDFYKTEYKPV